MSETRQSLAVALTAPDDSDLCALQTARLSWTRSMIRAVAQFRPGASLSGKGHTVPFLAVAALISGGGSMREPGALTGTWTLQAAYEIQPDGKLAYPYGVKPEGVLMVDDEGRYVVEIYDGSRSRFPSPKPTLEQYKAAFLSMSVHTGTVEVNETDHVLTFHVAHNGNPNRDMTVQQRPYAMEDDVLTYRVPAAAEGKVNTPVSVWKRVAIKHSRADRTDPADKRAPDL